MMSKLTDEETIKLRNVYEASRRVLRYNGVDKERTVAAVSELEDAIEAVKQLDGGIEVEESAASAVPLTWIDSELYADLVDMLPNSTVMVRDVTFRKTQFSNYDKPLFRASPTPPAKSEPITVTRDWVEDFTLENGQYYCQCRDCGNQFIGYKRRIICKVCADKNEPGVPKTRTAMTYDIGSFERKEEEIRKAFAAKDAEISNLKRALEQVEEALRKIKFAFDFADEGICEDQTVTILCSDSYYEADESLYKALTAIEALGKTE